MDNIVLTENGLALRDKLNAGQTTATFTRFCTSSAEYDQSELGVLTELKDSKLESTVTNLEIREDHTMVISGAVDNKSLQEGYYITLIGLYAKETDGEEILFAVSKASSPMYMPEKSGALSGMSIRFSVKIENSDSINVTVDPTTAATLGDLNALRSEVTTPTFEDYESEESPALPALEDAMKQIKSGNTMRVILQNTKAAFKELLNLVNTKVNQKDYDAAVSKLNEDITQLTENKANKDHTHDDRYYTKSEINTKMNENFQWSDKKSLGDNGCGISLYYRYNEGLKLVELEWDGSINQEITVGSAGYAWNGFPIDKSPKRNIYIPVTTKTNGVCIQFFPVDAQNANKFTLVTLISNVSNGYCCGKYLYSYN